MVNFGPKTPELRQHLDHEGELWFLANLKPLWFLFLCALKSLVHGCYCTYCASTRMNIAAMIKSWLCAQHPSAMSTESVISASLNSCLEAENVAFRQLCLEVLRIFLLFSSLLGGKEWILAAARQE